MNSDDVSKSVDNWEILESGGVDNNGSIGTLLVKSWIDNLEGADESVSVDFVGESGINDDTIEVAGLGRGEGSFVKLDVLVL